MEYVLETEGLTKRFGFKVAVDNVNMHVERGHIYGFVGLNGAGKTTVIRVVAGLSAVTSGGFKLFNKSNPKDIDIARKKISVMVEAPALYMNLSGSDNLKTVFDIKGIKGDAEALLKDVGLDNSKTAVKSYSLGMKQRLGIAMALCDNPEFLLLDEPTNGLDPEGIVEVRELLKKLNRERGITILVSSHILNELSKLADTYGFIDNGKLLREVSSEEIAKDTGRRTVAKVTDPVKAAEILGGRAKLNDDGLLIEDITITELVHELDKANISVNEITTVKRDLESYFLELLGGGNESK